MRLSVKTRATLPNRTYQRQEDPRVVGSFEEPQRTVPMWAKVVTTTVTQLQTLGVGPRSTSTALVPERVSKGPTRDGSFFVSTWLRCPVIWSNTRCCCKDIVYK